VSDYLTDEEQLAQLRNWWQEHGRSLLVGVVLVVAAVVGWRWYQSHTEQRTFGASDLYAEFQNSEGDSRDALARQIIEQSLGTAYPTFVLLRQADAAVAAGDPAAAEPLLRRAIELASGVERADLARLRLARVLLDNQRADEALVVLGEIRGAGYLALAAELKGDIHLARGERKLAHESYTAAMSYVQPGDQRPVLEMKIADTADTSDS
jgi:predicted negative regulator of RcsB-dependent stress response